MYFILLLYLQIESLEDKIADQALSLKEKQAELDQANQTVNNISMVCDVD